MSMEYVFAPVDTEDTVEELCARMLKATHKARVEDNVVVMEPFESVEGDPLWLASMQNHFRCVFVDSDSSSTFVEGDPPIGR